MKLKTIIKILIVVLLLLLVLVGIYGINIISKNKKEEYSNTSYNIQNNENILEDEYDESVFEESAIPEEGYNNSDYIYYNELEAVEYSNSQLDNINFNITNIPNEVVNYVINIDSVKKQIKKYVYLNGLIDSTIANYKTHQIQEENDKIAILFELDNKKKTQLIVIVNKKDNLVEIKER